jgi:hypothetical protein
MHDVSPEDRIFVLFGFRDLGSNKFEMYIWYNELKNKIINVYLYDTVSIYTMHENV